MAAGGVTETCELLHCSICLEEFKDPKLLPCSHTFCSSCLETFIENNRRKNTFQCPLCRTNIDVPPTGVQGFKTNVCIETWEDAMDNITMSCDLCGPNTRAVHRCIDCKENLCSACGSVHLKSRASRHHKVTDVAPSGSETARNLIPPVFCTIHPQETIQMYCKQCSCLICMTCNVASHETHPTADIGTEGQNMTKRLISIADGENVRTRLRTLENSISKRKESERKIEESLANGRKTMKNQAEAFHKYIDRLADEYEDDMKKTCNDRKHEIQEIREQLEEEHNSLTGYIGMIRLLMEHGSDIEVLRSGKQLERKLEKLSSKAEPENEPLVLAKLFTPGKIDEKALRSMFGNIVTADRKKKTLTPDCLKHVATINIPYDNISGIAPIGNGMAWISSCRSKYVLLVGMEGRVIQTAYLDSEGDDIATAGKDVIVSCPKLRVVKRIKSDNAETFISNLDMCPRGLASSTTADGSAEVFMAVTNSDCYYPKGNIYKCNTIQMTTRPSDVVGCKVPIRVAIEPSTGMICTADEIFSEVTVHDQSGKLVAKYVKCKPCSVHFYGNDKIIVVNSGKDVRVIRADGTLENVLMLGIYRSVAVDEDDNLWVGSDRLVQVFKIE